MPSRRVRLAVRILPSGRNVASIPGFEKRVLLRSPSSSHWRPSGMRYVVTPPGTVVSRAPLGTANGRVVSARFVALPTEVSPTERPPFFRCSVDVCLCARPWFFGARCPPERFWEPPLDLTLALPLVLGLTLTLGGGGGNLTTVTAAGSVQTIPCHTSAPATAQTAAKRQFIPNRRLVLPPCHKHGLPRSR